ncbi:MAG: relaxase/mobilization nuclease domain-containing protein [Oscillospiraceae bacterium]|nr:relaxase/mobilization nuclease domain-containing protein [Oscillospiraceae bacterium]
MASTGFWPVKSRLKEIIDYAENPDKTTDKKFLDDDLWAAIRYVENDDKTDQTMYVSGINCPKQRAYQCMMATKRRYGKLGGNVAYHGYQSFQTGEVTPEEAHKIGVETARRMWGDNYEIVVTTHLNTDNLHNHFVINSVSFKTGRKFENHIRDHVELRQISDAVCREHGKSVIPFTHFYGNKKAYWIRNSGNLAHRDMLRRDVDEALSKCTNFKAFEYYMKSLGYRFERDFRYEHPSVIADGWKRAVRITSLGEKYSREAMRGKLVANQRLPELYVLITPKWKRAPLLSFEYQLRKAQQKDTVKLLFELFIEILKLCTGSNIQQADNRPLSPMMRAEVQKLDKYIEEYKLLCDHHIESPKELLSLQENLSAQIAALERERYALRLKLRRVKKPEEDAALKEQCKEITKKITPLRNELKVALRIEEHIPRMKELLDDERQIEMKHNGLTIKKERGYER